MNRRGFLAAILGTAAATALPSEVWPFRKIFLPAAQTIIIPGVELNPLSIAAVEAIELEVFAKGIPDLLYKGNSMYHFFKKRAQEEVFNSFLKQVDEQHERKMQSVFDFKTPYRTV